MRVVIFGATGRVGIAAVRTAVAAGHAVRAAVRHIPAPSPFDSAVELAVADVLEPATVRAAVAGMDAVIVAVGGDVFKPSTIVTQSADVIVAAMKAEGVRRYIGITGVAQMQPSLTGQIADAVLGVSPIKHAVRDHQAHTTSFPLRVSIGRWPAVLGSRTMRIRVTTPNTRTRFRADSIPSRRSTLGRFSSAN